MRQTHIFGDELVRDIDKINMNRANQIVKLYITFRSDFERHCCLQFACLWDLPIRLEGPVHEDGGVNVGLLQRVEEDGQELQHVVPFSAATPV